MIQLIASDMDGTLLNSEMEISEANITAIKKAQAAGIEFVVATGRSIEEAKPILDAAKISCRFITSNGAQIFDKNGENNFTLGIDKDKLTQIIPVLREHKIYFELFTNNGGFTENIDSRLASVAHWLKSTSPNLSEAEALATAKSHMTTLPIHQVNNFNEVVENSELKVLKIFAMGQRHDPALALAKQELNNIAGLHVTSSGANNIEVNHIDAHKGASLKKMTDKLGIAMQDVAALGDNFNDVSMLQAAGLSIAMANGEAAVKQIAKQVTVANTQNGVAHAIDNILEKKW
ncbi:Cof-type HAD-IIB family hydrolase [Lactococcus paracarnosus]|uniref:HAD family phosphatase n=1 Tax=Pseudolactococcus paracarnosus TaxID=2749962 RepID=A0ABT0AMT0_9LACT|nr:Cof-type HAD-IIB family hydrolase [Lactococcus paracarnosus]MCJ1977875.1 HAD family phosphatase [Lactococcus paracarnosus]MCJ1983980.1 HAD family phosphatase [Lactococcus paracarnosus]MCJ1998126.1 HAD family phosphatase [Lactococcus paracarnosus]